MAMLYLTICASSPITTIYKLSQNIMNSELKRIIATVFIAAFLLTGCDSGGSSSGGDQVEESVSGDMLPAEFVGVYVGTISARLEASGISESETYEITITVNADGTIKFDGDDPDETFTVGIANDGTFSGNLRIDEDDVTGVLGVTGRVDGTTASGDVVGEGEFDTGIITIDIDVTGTFTATKQ